MLNFPLVNVFRTKQLLSKLTFSIFVVLIVFFIVNDLTSFALRQVGLQDT